ncbi:DM13 domain-containing protein [Streptomyces albireticuli]|uniref:Electron transporter n=1 Tax=Streptomyces albireticuli TaxID=1940 RepID=A0A2A2D068_9ACTN|nr:DM13 domain-containing protein [Streptomyces albireticuli]MCD9194647.1 DM13 domain-containing protein [Streptomyces albireticuli]PAU44905.1 electron transporter [Streptomyces albireticuli]
MGRVRRMLNRRVVIGVLLAGVLAVGAGVVWFQPWKLWVDTTVREAAPVAAEAGSRAPRTLAVGELISHEHTTTGKVRVLELPDGTRTLRVENLDTSNGPDVKVLLSDAPVKEGRAGWHVFDDGAHRSLGSLKGNKGDQNYALPAGLDLERYGSVSIWCDRFDVSFGAAKLTRV